MKKVILLLSFVFLTGNLAHAAKNCTEDPKSKWMTVDAFKAKVEADGYVIRKFKQPGTCFEIYGKDKNGKKVEIYFNPVDASIIKSKS